MPLTNLSTFTIYKDDNGDWRWRLQDGNSEIIADSSEGYSSEQSCRRAISNVRVEVED